MFKSFHVRNIFFLLLLGSGWFWWRGEDGGLQQGNSGPVMWTCSRAAHQQHPAAVEETEEPHGEARQSRYMQRVSFKTEVHEMFWDVKPLWRENSVWLITIKTWNLHVCSASKVQNQLETKKDVIPRETHEDEMEQMRREVQQCKEFIHAQQQLLQVSFCFTIREEKFSRSPLELDFFFIYILLIIRWNHRSGM